MTIGEHAYTHLETGQAATLYNFFHAQLIKIFILLINIKMPTFEMPTNVGILTFMSRINTTCERLKAKHNCIFSIF